MMPGEYVATGHPQGPDLFKREDLIATASLVGGIFGRGGGNELAWSQVADAFDKRFGKRRGARVFKDFRAAEDKAAPVTVLGKKRFPYQARPKHPRGVARPDRGSLRQARRDRDGRTRRRRCHCRAPRSRRAPRTRC